MKLAAIVYHRNVYACYPSTWIVQFRDSILGQTINVDLFELDYGGGANQIFPSAKQWWSCPLRNHAEAQNVLLDAVFDAGYDGAINTNVDDFYPYAYAEVCARQLGNGVQLSSGNFTLVNRDGLATFDHKDLHTKNIAEELARQENIICHPAVAYRKDFWEGCSRYVPTEVPLEDLRLWQREVNKFRFVIAPERLAFHRVHPDSVSARKGA